MVKTAHQVVGPANGLKFELLWRTSQDGNDDDSLVFGNIKVWIRDELVWGIDDDGQDSGVDWYWDQLLDFLSHSWSYLMLEETYPFDLEPRIPQFLRSAAEERWLLMPAETVELEDDVLTGFENSHDLANGVDGIDLPSLFLLKEGNNFVAATEGGVETLRFKETMSTLEGIGDLIYKRMLQLDSPRYVQIRNRWKDRKKVAQEHSLEIALSLPISRIGEIVELDRFEEFWEISKDDFQVNEVMAAARMAAYDLSSSEIRTIIERISAAPRTDTALLDRHSHDAADFVATLAQSPPYEQGYALAVWLRENIDIVSATGKAAPQRLLSDWGVEVVDIEMESDKLDALCCWGSAHGPCIFVNLKGPRSRYPTGRRSTLAHEICHLLLDREGSLPVAEVLGGRVPLILEQRANAFSAELLIPRSFARRIAEKYETRSDALSEVSRNFDVSFEVAAWQISNSGIKLTPRDHETLMTHTYAFRPI